jgi:hypothetical protein
MRKRESPPRTPTNLLMGARRRIDPEHLPIPREQHSPMSEQIDFGVGIKVLHLPFEPLGICDVIGIHPRNILTAGLCHTVI